MLKEARRSHRYTYIHVIVAVGLNMNMLHIFFNYSIHKFNLNRSGPIWPLELILWILIMRGFMGRNPSKGIPLPWIPLWSLSTKSVLRGLHDSLGCLVPYSSRDVVESISLWIVRGRIWLSRGYMVLGMLGCLMSLRGSWFFSCDKILGIRYAAYSIFQSFYSSCYYI